jgi:thiamine transport system substrate-binding protein
MNRNALLLAALVAVPILAGCTTTPTSPSAPAPKTYAELGYAGNDPAGRNTSKWPDLAGQTVTILDQGAFDYLYSAAKPLFENLTHAKVVHVAAVDAGDALNRAIREKGDPSFDVVYGIDNVLYSRAAAAGVFEPYKPLLASRIQAPYLFFDATGPWYATPADHGYIALNVDPRSGLHIANLTDVKRHADRFVTEDPRSSSPGLGFLIATVATFGDKGTSAYDYLHYWDDLFNGHVLITAGWPEAYLQHFSGGYGAPEAGGNGKADKPIVTSYTSSPAYEVYYNVTPHAINEVVTAPKSTFHQVETMAIAKGTRNLAAAQAWVEFTLTDAYQEQQAPQNAVYPVVAGVDVGSVYGGRDPAPGSFADAGFTAEHIGANVERWVREWTDAYEHHQAS